LLRKQETAVKTLFKSYSNKIAEFVDKQREALSNAK
jgi:hypothetical protein